MRGRYHSGASRLACLAFLVGAHAAFGCSYPISTSFRDLVAAASSVAVVEVEAQRKVTQQEDGYEYEYVVADVRVVEALVGGLPRLQRIKYHSHWCGGHWLQVGRFYVVVLETDTKTLRLGAGAESVLGLGDEYKEAEGSASSKSYLLMHIRNFKSIGQVPEGFNVMPYLSIVNPRQEWPSYEARR